MLHEPHSQILVIYTFTFVHSYHKLSQNISEEGTSSRVKALLHYALGLHFGNLCVG